MYVVSYDISEDKLRARVAKELENYGVRVQYSVFECDLSVKRYRELYQKLLGFTSDMEEGNFWVMYSGRMER